MRYKITTYISTSAIITGNVKLKNNVSVWHNCVIRGDLNEIYIGEFTNIQDGSILHCDPEAPLKIGKKVSVGHNAVLHGCTVEDNCIIGIGAVVSNNAVVGSNCIIAPGAVVTEKQQIPSKTIFGGVPAKKIKDVDKDNIQRIERTWKMYIELAKKELTKKII